MHTTTHSFFTWVLWRKLDSSDLSSKHLPHWATSLAHPLITFLINRFRTDSHLDFIPANGPWRRSVTRIPSSGDKVKGHWPWFSALTVLPARASYKDRVPSLHSQVRQRISLPFPHYFLAMSGKHVCIPPPALSFLLRPLCSHLLGCNLYLGKEMCVRQREPLS